MPVIATSDERFGNVIKFLDNPFKGYHFEVVTMNTTAGTYALGTVLAKVNATGKYVVQDAGLATGAGLEAAGVLIGMDENNMGATLAGSTDTKVLMLARGPARVAKEQLIFGAGTDTAAEKQAVYDALAALGIVADTQI